MRQKYQHIESFVLRDALLNPKKYYRASSPKFTLNLTQSKINSSPLSGLVSALETK